MNRNLGNYDMVLALSNNKINYQFTRMYKRKIIHNKWAFLTNSTGEEVETITDEEATQFWDNLENLKSSLAAKKQKLLSVDREIQDRIKEKDWEKVSKLAGQKDVLQGEVDSLINKVKQANLYDLSLIANIAPPQVDIIKNNSKDLILKIPFESGSKLYYTHEGKKMEYDLGSNKIVYAFRVAVGKVRINADKKVVEVDENGKSTEKTLREKGINDNDFTISALFLDFENANIAEYDSLNSKLPDDLNHNALLQAAMTNYFKNLATSEHPYVLGYAINKKEIKQGERALFYPSGVTYSTSHSTEKRASTFNFLMLLNNHAYPSGADAGVLPHSLMSYAQDTTSTVNGAFGLNISEFEENYVNKLSPILKDRIRMKMGSRYHSGDVRGKDIEIRFGNGRNAMYLQYRGIEADSNGKGANIVYGVMVEALVHQEIRELIGTVGVDWPVSTNGRERNRHGHEGKLVVSLKAGASGKLELKVNNKDKFKLGFDTDKPIYKGEWDGFWDALNKAIGKFIEVISNLEINIGKDLNDLSELDNLAEDLNIDNLQNLENKVILPISSVYTYKNVRLLESNDEANRVLLFDTSYKFNDLKN